ncbi:TonB-dependent receptor [Alkalilimnicola ehrlichii]|uniref:TonB-dependent receptor n=1 Tax=Alkalilimnicola ehrlichii TaxID=351052 RepID=A0A3E0WJP3_9GAMM|nr:TonB-dependent receptor [Alkalilimnicola ehrlichii]RFA32361.1 hypothetical protein CAL65_19965 [Alkalilimnicola ehrlichii]
MVLFRSLPRLIKPTAFTVVASLPMGLAAEEFRTELDPLMVTPPRLDIDPMDSPFAVDVLDMPLIQRGAQDLDLSEALDRVPGLFTQNRYNQAQGLRMSIRGFGARAAFGVRGVRVMLDGIPLTLPDGQTQLDGLDMTLLDRMEVIRGPFSAAYGNASGGVVHMVTQDAPEEPFVTVRGQTGAYGLRELALRGGVTPGDWNLFGGVRGVQRDGYRDHSESESYSLYGKARYNFNDTASLTTIVNASRREADDPGGLTRAEWREDRRQAAGGNETFNAGEKVDQQRLAWIFRDDMHNGDSLVARAFVGRRDFENRLPFPGGGQVAFDRLFSGVGLQYTFDRQWWGRSSRLVLGIDAEHQRDDRQRYDNNNGVRGAQTLDQEETVANIGVYLENELAVTDRFTLTLGGRYDQVRLEVEDAFADDPADDASGTRTLDELSWMIGGSFALTAQHRLYGNVATVFETPTTNELANPAGRGFNPDLESQTAVNYELGLKGELGGRLDYDLAVFTIRLRDELVPFELAGEDGRTYYRNAGRSRRDGFEASVNWWFWEPLRLSAAYAYSDFYFRDFEEEVDDALLDHSDRYIPGIPQDQLFVELAYDGTRRFAAIGAQYVGRMYADNANQERVGGYALVNARVGQQLSLGGAGDWQWFAGVNNIFDRDYATNVRINANRQAYYERAGAVLVCGCRGDVLMKRLLNFFQRSAS